MIKVNENEIAWHEGLTVTEALKVMNYDFPHLTVTINGTFVAPLDYDSFQIPDEADVRAIHLFHGG